MNRSPAMRLEYWFDFSCPYAYLGSEEIEALARRAGADLRWRPMLLGGVFRAVETPDVPAERMSPPKARHNALDMLRWAEHLGVPLRMPARHPMRTVRALRALLSLPEPEWPPVIHALYRAYWVRGDDVTTADGVAAALAAAGVAGPALDRALAADGDPGIRDDLRRRTQEAIDRGVFGAPTIFVGDGADRSMFWGQDRFPMVELALAGWRPLLEETR
jgi:2-hydroxychromene-2-carboxylate isomerase